VEPTLGWTGDREGQNLGPKGLGPTTSRSDIHDTWLPPCFCAPNDITRYTTEELLDIIAQYATNEEAAGATLVSGVMEVVPGSSRAMPSNIVVQGTEKDAKGGDKKRQKWRARWVTVASDCNDNDDKKVKDSDKEFVMVAERGIKHQA
jgi:hypothetical protein